MTETQTPAITPDQSAPAAKIDRRGLLITLLIDAVIPFIAYIVLQNYLHTSNIVALSVAALIPALGNVYSLIRSRKLDLLGILVMVGVAAGVIGVLLGGSAKLLLIRGSFVTGALGVACFISLLLPRPLMFYIGRQMMAGDDPEKVARFNAEWQYPYARFVHRMITAAWGFVYVGEFIIRVVMVFTLPAAVVLIASPIILTIATVAAIALTFVYVRHAYKRGAEM